MNRYDVLRFCIPVIGGLMFPLVMLFRSNPFMALGILGCSLLLVFICYVTLTIRRIRHEDLEEAKKEIHCNLSFIVDEWKGFSISLINRESKLHVMNLIKRCFGRYYEKYNVYTSTGEYTVVMKICSDLVYIDHVERVSTLNYKELIEQS
ncbi:hypothetical protein [Bacillus sp. NPDC094106]|uniref:hypothetical protein n=1 Tax=Bacillus sp. NPDC094106 TaxID=3363949 RepID=UPI003827C80D